MSGTAKKPELLKTLGALLKAQDEETLRVLTGALQLLQQGTGTRGIAPDELVGQLMNDADAINGAVSASSRATHGPVTASAIKAHEDACHTVTSSAASAVRFALELGYRYGQAL